MLWKVIKEMGHLAAAFFLKRVLSHIIIVSKDEDGFEGTWDSFNIVDVNFDGNNFVYHLNSTILIEMDINNKGINLTGFLKKSVYFLLLRNKSEKIIIKVLVNNNFLVIICRQLER